MPTYHRTAQPTAIAPDGAQIRNLIHREQGATRLSLAEALVPPGQRTTKICHQTVYEELWYILQGTGTFHLHPPDQPDEEVMLVAPGDTVFIPVRHGFFVENTGDTALVFLCCGAPPWPGDDEAQPWPPPL